MESKYYTPKIEEFYVGFLFETYEDRFNSWKLNSIHNMYDYQTVFHLRLEKDRGGMIVDSNYIRVKYLDSSDIESFGFKKSNKNSWVGYKDYFLDNINPEYPYFLFATIHVPIRDDMYKILVHRYYSEDEPIDEDDNYKEPTVVYIGMLNDSIDLGFILKMTKIIDDTNK